MNGLTTIILAAGYGKRMHSKLPKVLHKVSGDPMVKHVVDLARALESKEIVCIVGHGKEAVMDALSSESIQFAVQAEQLGTGHAVMMADAYFGDGDCLVLFGDTPLLKPETLKVFMDYHREGNYQASLISMVFEEPKGYGRIVRDASGEFLKIVEHKDCNGMELDINEVNSGIGLFKAALLKKALNGLKNDNSQNEYYLTDVFELIRNDGGRVGAYIAPDADELMGVNDRLSLSVAERIMQKRILEGHMLSGVTIVSPETTYIEKNVKIGQDTILYHNTRLCGNTVVGEDCLIGPGADICDTVIMNAVTVLQSTVKGSKVDEKSAIGPYAYLRPGSDIGKDVKIGDFVEVKNAKIGDHTKVSHLTYVGDGVVGSNVNLGCGVVFVNYDGVNKHLTTIEDDVFVGCNSNLVAPVTIGRGAYVAAGSTITEDVPSEALAIARERQVNKTNWSNKYAKKK